MSDSDSNADSPDSNDDLKTESGNNSQDILNMSPTLLWIVKFWLEFLNYNKQWTGLQDLEFSLIGLNFQLSEHENIIIEQTMWK